MPYPRHPTEEAMKLFKKWKKNDKFARKEGTECAGAVFAGNKRGTIPNYPNLAEVFRLVND